MIFRLLSMWVSIYVSNVVMKALEEETRLWEDWERSLFMIYMAGMWMIVLTVWEMRKMTDGPAAGLATMLAEIFAFVYLWTWAFAFFGVGLYSMLVALGLCSMVTVVATGFYVMESKR